MSPYSIRVSSIGLFYLPETHNQIILSSYSLIGNLIGIEAGIPFDRIECQEVNDMPLLFAVIAAVVVAAVTVALFRSFNYSTNL